MVSDSGGGGGVGAAAACGLVWVSHCPAPGTSGLAATAVTADRLRQSTDSLGFSLLGLVMVAVLLTVLVTLAVPAYQQYHLRVERMKAISALTTMAA